MQVVKLVSRRRHRVLEVVRCKGSQPLSPRVQWHTNQLLFSPPPFLVYIGYMRAVYFKMRIAYP